MNSYLQNRLAAQGTIYHVLVALHGNPGEFDLEFLFSSTAPLKIWVKYVKKWEIRDSVRKWERHTFYESDSEIQGIIS